MWEDHDDEAKKTAANICSNEEEEEQPRQTNSKGGVAFVLYQVGVFIWAWICWHAEILSWISVGAVTVALVVLFIVVVYKQKKAPPFIDLKPKEDDQASASERVTLQGFKDAYAFKAPCAAIIGGACGLFMTGVWLWAYITQRIQNPPYTDYGPGAALVMGMYMMTCPIFFVPLISRFNVVRIYEEVARRGCK